MTISFAKAMSNFARLTEIEAKSATMIDISKIPRRETRKFIKTDNAASASRTPLMMYMKDVFLDVELAHLDLVDKKPFRVIFRSPDSTPADIYSFDDKKKVCHTTVDIISRFFNEDMGISSSVEEVKCRRNGDEFCEFVVDMQPLELYDILMDDIDTKILKKINTDDIDSIKKEFDFTDDELKFRLSNYRKFMIIDDNNKLTENGEMAIMFIDEDMGTEKKIDENFLPPWKDMERITNAISSAESFAEAVKEISDDDVPWLNDDDAEVVDAEEAASDAKSFAELLSSMTEKEDD